MKTYSHAESHCPQCGARYAGYLTEQEIVDRAAEETGEYLHRWLRRWTVAGLIVCLVGLFRPVHIWLHAHLELLLGFLLGTLAQSIPWLIDRWRWMKWFNWQ